MIADAFRSTAMQYMAFTLEACASTLSMGRITLTPNRQAHEEPE